MLGQFASQVGGSIAMFSSTSISDEMLLFHVARARIEGLLRSLGAPLEPLGWPWERRGVLGGPHGGPGRASERFWRSLRALGSILLESNGPKSLRFLFFF